MNAASAAPIAVASTAAVAEARHATGRALAECAAASAAALTDAASSASSFRRERCWPARSYRSAAAAAFVASNLPSPSTQSPGCATLPTLSGISIHRTFRRCSIACTATPSCDPSVTTFDRQLAAGLGVYVHCWAGVGRTGTVVGCWLIRHQLAQSDNVLSVIAKRSAPSSWCNQETADHHRPGRFHRCRQQFPFEVGGFGALPLSPERKNGFEWIERTPPEGWRWTSIVSGYVASSRDFASRTRPGSVTVARRQRRATRPSCRSSNTPCGQR